jgi:Putative Flp pilus-assembly TadE/G-like
VSRPRGERGALTPAVLILAIMIFWLAGLVIDGARQLNARSRAIAYAQEAARAGASGINLNVQKLEFDPKDVRARVDAYCAEARANDDTITRCGLSKEPDAENLEVAVELKNPTTFLSMLGVQSLTAKGQGEAHAEQGINKADETPRVPSISVLQTSQGPGEDPKASASTPTFDPPCTPNPPTVTITETTTSPKPTPPPPKKPTATVTVTVTTVTTSPGPVPTICHPPGQGR